MSKHWPQNEEFYSGLRSLFLGFIREYVGEGNDQLVDDMFTSNDGRYIYASRPRFADVVAIDVNSGQIVWRTQVEVFELTIREPSSKGSKWTTTVKINVKARLQLRIVIEPKN